MCPACVANVGFIAASAASTSGFAALAVKKALLKWHAKPSRGERDKQKAKNEERSEQGKRSEGAEGVVVESVGSCAPETAGKRKEVYPGP
jgi:hypothetical protein